jgi:hypothetical protein
MAFHTINLPTGTAITRQINLPTCGAWQGLVQVSLATRVNATVAELLFIYPNHSDGKIRYRRTGGTSGNNYSNWTLLADRRVVRWLFHSETLMNITYTATTEISVCIETTRGITPLVYPTVPVNPHPTEAQAPGVTENGKIYWKASA